MFQNTKKFNPLFKTMSMSKSLLFRLRKYRKNFTSYRGCCRCI